MYADLLMSAHLGHADLLELLLDRGAEVNMQSNSGISALMIACFVGNTEMVELLLHHGAQVNMRDSAGVSALIIASAAGCIDVFTDSWSLWSL